MDLSPSGEAASCAATQELPSNLCIPKVYYRFHKIYILSHKNLVHTTPPITVISILILSIYLCLGLPNGLFASGFPTNNIYT
jgi:hypothetical protein